MIHAFDDAEQTNEADDIQFQTWMMNAPSVMKCSGSNPTAGFFARMVNVTLRMKEFVNTTFVYSVAPK